MWILACDKQSMDDKSRVWSHDCKISQNARAYESKGPPILDLQRIIMGFQPWNQWGLTTSQWKCPHRITRFRRKRKALFKGSQGSWQKPKNIFLLSSLGTSHQVGQLIGPLSKTCFLRQTINMCPDLQANYSNLFSRPKSFCI